MTEATKEAATDDASPIDAGAFCARCGYDLRGLASGRCPECGVDLAEQRALVGAIPWTHRAARGRVATFVRTAWDVLAAAPWTRYALAGPVALADARAFWRAAAMLAAAPLVLGFCLAWWRASGLWFLAMMPVSNSLVGMAGIAEPLPQWWLRSTLHEWVAIDSLPARPAWLEYDWVWPLSAGWTRPGVGPVAIALAVLLGSGAATYFAHPRGLDAARRRRSLAYGYYVAGATLASAAPFGAIAVGAIAWSFLAPGPALGAAMLTLALGLIGVVAAIALGYARLIGSIRKATGRTTPTAVAAIGVPVACAVAAGFALLAIPWAVGAAWLMIDAMRR